MLDVFKAKLVRIKDIFLYEFNSYFFQKELNTGEI